MDASTLARELDTLETSWSSLDGWLKFWTALVVVGVVIEPLVIACEFRHDWKDFKRSVIYNPERPSILLLLLSLLGAGLVALGVAGEFRIHTQAGKVESDMRSKSLELVAITQKSASDANERTRILEVQIKGYDKEISDANERAAGAQKTAESERLERVRLETRLVALRRQSAARRLSGKQQEKLADLLRPKPTPLLVAWYPGDNESRDLGNDLIETLTSAKWTPVKGMLGPGGPYGVVIRGC